MWDIMDTRIIRSFKIVTGGEGGGGGTTYHILLFCKTVHSLIVEVIRIFLQNRIWVMVFDSSFIQVVISQNELELLGRVEK